MPPKGTLPSWQRPWKTPRAVNGAKSHGHTPLLLLLSSIPSGAAAETGKQRHMSTSCKICGWKRTSREDYSRWEQKGQRETGNPEQMDPRSWESSARSQWLAWRPRSLQTKWNSPQVFRTAGALPTPCSLFFPGNSPTRRSWDLRQAPSSPLASAAPLMKGSTSNNHLSAEEPWPDDPLLICSLPNTAKGPGPPS